MKLFTAFFSTVIAAVALVFTGALPASGQLTAYDDAGNYLVTANWTNGANRGFGFTPWVILTNSPATPGGYQGWYITVPATYANASITNVAGTNYACAWALYANGTNAVNETTAFRGFASTLGTNTFKLQWGSREAGTTTVNGGTVHGYSGFTLRAGNATNTADDFQTGVRLYLYFLDGSAPSTLYVWDGNGVQSLPGTSFSNLGRDGITNAIQAEITPSADGASYHMVLKDVVAGQVLVTFDGIFIGGPGTEDSVAMFDRETQSPGDQVYNRMQIAAPQIGPEVNNVSPTNTSVFLPADTQLSFEVDSFNSTVATNAVAVYLNGVPQTGATYNTTVPSNQLLGSLNPVLQPNLFYTYTIVAQDANGFATTNVFNFNTFSPDNTCIQAEDYNYNSGQYFPNPTPLEYAGLLGSNGVDYLELTTLTNLNNYRPDYNTADPIQPQLIPATDLVDHDQYFEDNIQDYQLAYTDAGEWENYTRSFPGTAFTLYARAASGGGGLFQVNLLANPTATTTNQPLAALGTCSVPNTGGTTVYGGQLTPVADLFGNPVVLNLAGTQTLQQAVISSRAYNLYYLMLVPSTNTSVLTPYISVGSPAPGAINVPLAGAITFTIANRQTAVVTNTIKLLVNNTNVSTRLKMVTNAAGVMVTFTLTTNLPQNYTNTISVVFGDNTGTNSVTNNWSFVTAGNGGLAGTGLWSGGGGADMQWSTAANWTGGTPGPGYNAIFATPGATTTLTTNNIVSTNLTILGLYYNTNASGYHTTLITNGVTLTVTNGTTSTVPILQAGGGVNSDNDFAPGVTNTITGGGGTLMLLGNPTGSGVNSLNIQVRQASLVQAPEHVVLDMSGLGTLVATVGKLTVGQGGTGAAQSNCTARVSLARTNIISTLRNVAGQIVVGDSSGGSNTLMACTLNLGITNALYFDSMNVGKQKATNALVRFNPLFAGDSPAAFIRDTNGTSSRVSAWDIGDANTEVVAVPVYAQGTVDFSAGTLDALVGTMIVARGATTAADTGYALGTFMLGAGVLNVTNLQVGVQRAANTATVSGVVNVNAGGTLVSTNGGITLAQSAGGSGPILGTLNITNGTVVAGITAGGGTSTINLNGGTLAVVGTAGTAAARISALNLTGGALQLSVNGSNTTAIINAAAVAASGTTVSITSISNVTTTTLLHLLSYTGADPYAGLTLGALPAGYTGALVDNSGSIDLNVSVGAPRAPTIQSIVLSSGGQLVISGTNNGGSSGTYHVLTATNLLTPLAGWSVLTNGSFGAGGSFSSTNAVGTNSQQFYLLEVP